MSKLWTIPLVLVLVGCPGKEQPLKRVASAGKHMVLKIDVSERRVVVKDIHILSEALTPAEIHDQGSWRVEVLDAAGKVLSSNDLDPPNIVHTHMLAPDGGSPEVVLSMPSGTFEVALPVTPTGVRVRVLADPKSLPSNDGRINWVPVDGRVPLGDAPYPASGR